MPAVSLASQRVVRGSIVKRCVYFGLCSPFCHYLAPFPHSTHALSGDVAVEIQPVLQITFVTEKEKSPPSPSYPLWLKKSQMLFFRIVLAIFWCVPPAHSWQSAVK